MTDRPNRLERLRDDDALLEAVQDVVSGSAFQFSSGSANAHLERLLNDSASCFSDALMHPEDEPNWDGLISNQEELEAWSIVLDLFVGDQHLAEKALAFYKVVSTGLAQLRKLDGVVERPPDFVDEGPHPLPDEATRNQVETVWKRAKYSYEHGVISKLVYAKQLRACLDPLHDLPVAQVSLDLYTRIRQELYALYPAGLPLDEDEVQRDSIVLPSEVLNKIGERLIGMQQSLERHIIDPDTFYERVEDLVSQLRALKFSQVDQEMRRTQMLHTMELMLPQAQDPDPAPAPAPDPSDTVDELLHMYRLDVWQADGDLLNRQIGFAVWHERMMQIFERCKREIPLTPETTERRRNFLWDMQPRLVAGPNGAWLLAEESARQGVPNGH